MSRGWISSGRSYREFYRPFIRYLVSREVMVKRNRIGASLAEYWGMNVVFWAAISRPELKVELG
jgi:hypothetical protein